MICNTRNPNPEKFRFASDKGIPAVHASWLWDCIFSGSAEPYDRYLLNTIQSQPQKSKERSQASFAEVPTAPLSEEDSLKLRQRKARNAKPTPKPRGGLRRPGPLELSLSGPSTPASTTGSSTNQNTTANDSSLDQDEPLSGAFDGAGSLPLQEINPSVNSPRRPSASSTGSISFPTKSSSTRSDSISDAPTKSAGGQLKPQSAKEATPDPAVSARDTRYSEEKARPPEKDYSEIMSKLLATRKTTNLTEKEDEQGRRKRRPLGRAQSMRSNPSTNEDILSRQNSMSLAEEGEEGDGIEKLRKGFELPEPSQELGWDSPGAQKARERMIRAMGGKVEEGRNALEGIGVVKDSTGGVAGYARSMRKRK